MISMLVQVDVFLIGKVKFLMEMCVAGWLGTGFYGGSYGITLGIYKEIELGFSDIYFEVCSGGNIEGLVKLVQDGINSGSG